MYKALEEVRINPEELNQLTSLVSVQTKGLKRQNESNSKKPKLKNEGHIPENILKNSGAKRRKLVSTQLDKVNDNPNIVGFHSSSSDSESSNESDVCDENEKIKEECVQVNVLIG